VTESNPFEQGDLVYDERMRRFVIFDMYTGDGFAQVFVLDGTGDACYPQVSELRPARPDERQGTA
jgi:hypothetical protein